jgi:hypothetical protein
MTTVTFVTALFNINREKNGDGRKFNDYLNWLSKTLEVKVPIVIFTTNDLNDFFYQNRTNNYPIKIINQNIEDLYFYKYKNIIKNIILSEEYKKKIKAPERVECVNEFYNIIQYNKFDWLSKISKTNPFNTETFYWIDAGISRFFDNYDLNKEYKIKKNIPNDKLNIQCRIDLETYPIDKNFYWDSFNLLTGTMFGGNNTIIEKLYYMIINEMEFMIKNNQMNNEQMALAVIWKNNKDLFFTIKNNTYRHLPFFNLIVE